MYWGFTATTEKICFFHLAIQFLRKIHWKVVHKKNNSWSPSPVTKLTFKNIFKRPTGLETVWSPRDVAPIGKHHYRKGYFWGARPRVILISCNPEHSCSDRCNRTGWHNPENLIPQISWTPCNKWLYRLKPAPWIEPGSKLAINTVCRAEVWHTLIKKRTTVSTTAFCTIWMLFQSKADRCRCLFQSADTCSYIWDVITS